MEKKIQKRSTERSRRTTSWKQATRSIPQESPKFKKRKVRAAAPADACGNAKDELNFVREV